jgi:hypothetical protein
MKNRTSRHSVPTPSRETGMVASYSQRKSWKKM